jgi:hypothetical protein
MQKTNKTKKIKTKPTPKCTKSSESEVAHKRLKGLNKNKSYDTKRRAAAQRF